MIIQRQEDVTPVVLDAFKNIDRSAPARNPRRAGQASARLRARCASDRGGIREGGAAIIAKLGQKTNDTHNEVVLMSGSLGFSALICLLNNGNNGQTETTANLLGPFWRMNSPRTENGGSIVRSPTPGPALFVNCWVKDQNGKPIAGAEVDIWHSSPEGFYEQQDPKQAT